MRRSSVIVLVLAFLLLGGLAFLYYRPLDRDAPPPTREVAVRLLEQGRTALEWRDVDGIMALTTPDARLLNLPPDKMRQLLANTMAQLGRENLTISWSNVEVRTQGGTVNVSFNLRVGQETQGMSATYYSSRVRLELKKVRIPHWFGLYTTEEWRVYQADADRSLDVPML